MIQQQTGLNVGGQGGQTPQSVPQGTPQQGQPTGLGQIPQAPQQARQGAVSGNMQLSGINVGQSGASVSFKPKQQPKLSATQTDAINNANIRLNSIKDLRKQADKIKAPKLGLAAGLLRSGIAQASGGRFDTELKLYNDSLPLHAVGFYRDASGDNRINNEDARERAMPFFWRPGNGEVLALKNRKFDLQERMLKERAQMLKEGTYKFDPETNSFITPLEAILQRLTPKGSQTQVSQQIGRFSVEVE